MPYAEFEEKEYEGPLNRELLGRSRNLWTPGQVFEFYFGIDAGLLVSNSNFWRMMGFPNPPVGVSLPTVRWNALWRAVGFVRRLPAFDLNLFLQVKRPFVVSKPRGKFANLFTPPFWRFELTGHQQRALQRLAAKVGSNGLVAYGCAAFDSLQDLFVHIPAARIVANSTFVKASALTGHAYWVYDSPGTAGVKCSEPVDFEDKSFEDQIGSLSQSGKDPGDQTPDVAARYCVVNLELLARQMLETCSEEVEGRIGIANREASDVANDQGNVRAQFVLDNAISAQRFSDDILLRGIVAYHDIRLFCHTFDLHWHTVG